ncbi:hypothetical protein LTR62_000399 [Meristemomyces frigidus]|uniref:Uncharacterized protein n=1 Tax=Meristemomyces frigidus TaxID=1508187 RepID=A0AAN7TLD3_9PEZI|nr:hypothetical protein LTR62_000399 [Meristemomyces frigidus]
MFSFLPSRKPSLAHSAPVATYDAQKQSTQVTVEETSDPINYRSNHIKHWSLELLSAASSLACLAGLVIFLCKVDGKPYSSWHIAGVAITPNTLLSLLATICKASFLLCVAESISQLKWLHVQRRTRPLADLQRFDAASRGQLGALSLLWKINYRAALACLGAVVVVLAIATDPLTNQILTVRTSLTPVNNVTASIGTSSTYGLRAMNSTDPISQPLNNAMVRGLYGASVQANYSCPSGECAWPKFESLGICSTCLDMSKETEIECGACMPNSKTPGTSTIYSNVTCAYTTPGGVNDSVVLQSYDNRTVVPNILMDSMVLDSGLLWTNTTNSSETMALSMDDAGGIATWSTLRFDQAYAFEDDTFEDYACARVNGDKLPGVRPVASRCTLGWCINTFASTHFSGGILSDEATSQRPLKIAYEHCFVPPESQQPGGLFLCPVYPADEGEPPAALLHDPWTAPPPGSNVFWINDVITQDIQTYMVSTFSYGIGTPGTDTALIDVPALQQTFYTANGGNISITLANIARSMTNQIRQGPETSNVAGQLSYPVTYIRVRWVWLAYLAALCLMSVVFLWLTIVASSRHRTPVWKSSVLAYFLHGASVNDGCGLDMAEAAKGMWVCMDEAGRLVVSTKPR